MSATATTESEAAEAAGLVRTVRDATFDVLREHDLTTLFANPGSTEVSFLAGLPEDLDFVLALHEGSVVGMATGYAIGRDRPALVLLHTTAGLGNAVGALATARVNRAPLVVIVGQQDRRHLALEPFLAGRLDGLAGEYPVWVDRPVRAQDVPAAIARAAHEAVTGRGPAIVIVHMDDWDAPAGADTLARGPQRMIRPTAADAGAVGALAAQLDAASSPAMVVGAGAGDTETWDALVALAERLACPVFQESFGGRAGFPQDHPQFAGHLPADRPRLRSMLAGHDALLVVGAPVFRQYPYSEGALLPDGMRVALVTDDAAEAHRSPTEITVLGTPSAICAALVTEVAEREQTGRPRTPQPALDPPGAGQPLRAGHVLTALAERLPRETILVEESPSSRPELERRLPAREPLGFVSAAMGGLGFALPAATGLRMAQPGRPVVAVVGDGSSLYQVQALWSAQRYGIGVLFIVLANGRYAVMDRLAERRGSAGPWPGFEEIDVSGLARALGCEAHRIETHGELLRELDATVPGLVDRNEPLVLEIAVAADHDFQP